MLVQRGKRVKDQALSEPIPLFDEKDRQFFKFYFGCFFMTVVAVYNLLITKAQHFCLRE